MSSDPKRAAVHDDGDDDLDDLDDVLDQFTPSKPSYNASNSTSTPLSSLPPPASSSLSPTSSTSSAKAGPPPPVDDATPDWASEFAQSMESFMREITAEFEAGKAGEVGADAEGLGSGSGGLGMGLGDPPKDETPEQKAERLKREEAFAAAWEAMLVEGMNGLGVGEGDKNTTAPSVKASSSSSIPKPVPPPADDYQARIRATMNKLKESESTLNQSQNPASSSSDPLEALLAQLGQGGLDGLGEGEGGEEQLQGMLEAMMGQLMSKDVLYEPLKELADKFPAYLTKNAATLSASDKSRYEAQISCIQRLLSIFDDPAYKDDNKEKKEEVLHAMSELQSHGSPPEDLMGPLPPGFNMGTDGLPNMSPGGECVIC